MTAAPLPFACPHTSGRVEDHGRVFTRRCLLQAGHDAGDDARSCRWSGWMPTEEPSTDEVEAAEAC